MLLYNNKMISKINVLQVIPKLGYGGAETGCYDIAHYLAEEDCGSYIATSGGELLKFVKKNKVGIFKLPVHSKNPILIILNALFLSILIIFDAFEGSREAPEGYITILNNFGMR